MDDRGYQYLYVTDSTGCCHSQTPETADPSALGSRMRNYTVIYSCGPASLAAEGLGSRMARDRTFVDRVEAGWADLEKGRVASIDDIKRRLGDV